MTSCPVLVEFQAPSLSSLDIYGVVWEDTNDKGAIRYKFHPHDWVCLNFRRLEVYIHGLEGRQKCQRPILHQLSRLKKLEILNIESHNHNSESLSHDGLDLRLKYGLDISASLKRLEKISFDGLWQRLDVQDVKWMLQEWPNLKGFQGKPHVNKVVCRRIEAIFEDNLVENSCCDWSD
ncbi:hypothetical protein BGX26_001238 [Mortierella sp. AD094]|nr:hypothetical protein BGX26_001238 [Mortierella sp. AD094]